MTFSYDLTDEERAEATAEAQRLIDEDCWYQTSRKYRSLARLPKGKTGQQALLEYELHVVSLMDVNDTLREYWHKEKTRWVNVMGEASAGSFFLGSYHAKAFHCSDESVGVRTALDIELPPFTFNEWRRLGGETYSNKHWKIRLCEDEARDMFRLAIAWRKERFPDGQLVTSVLKAEQILLEQVMKLEEKYAYAIEGSHV